MRQWNNYVSGRIIRNKIIAPAHLKWTMHFGCVKGHAGIEGNEFVINLRKNLLWKMDQLYTTRCQERRL